MPRRPAAHPGDRNLARPPAGQQWTAADIERIRRRYPTPTRRATWIVLAVIIALVLGSWMIWAGLEHARPGISGQLHGYRVIDTNHVEATVNVHRPDPATRGECTVQAQAISGEVVGELTFPVTGATKDTTHKLTVKTSLRATTAILLNCQRA